MDVMHLTLAELIPIGKMAIANALKNEIIMEHLADFKYTARRLAEGQDLLTHAESLITTQVGELGDQINATEVKDGAWAAADKFYMRLLKAARLVIHKAGDRTTLDLDGNRENGYLAWLGQTKQFYTQALARPDLLDQLDDLNVTAAKLQAGLALVTALEAARETQQSQIGVKQNATEDRDKVLGDLRAWLSKYLAVAELALEEEPQLLESLGVLVRNGPRAQPPVTPAPATETPNVP
jgi:hypothetical protein